jgi:hypothetical protein
LTQDGLYLPALSAGAGWRSCARLFLPAFVSRLYLPAFVRRLYPPAFARPAVPAGVRAPAPALPGGLAGPR